jgi:hypothetical protein
MAKSSGIAWTTLTCTNSAASPINIVNDVNSMDISTPRAMQEVTGLDKSAIERLHLLADFQITMNGIMNPAVSHLVFRDFGSGARTMTLVVLSQTLTPPTVLFDDYALSRSDKGELTWKVKGMGADGTVAVWS